MHHFNETEYNEAMQGLAVLAMCEELERKVKMYVLHGHPWLLEVVEAAVSAREVVI